MRCSICGAEMKVLFTSEYCPNNCDKMGIDHSTKEKEDKNVEEWVIDVTPHGPLSVVSVEGVALHGNNIFVNKVSYSFNLAHLHVLSPWRLSAVDIMFSSFGSNQGYRYSLGDPAVINVVFY